MSSTFHAPVPSAIDTELESAASERGTLVIPEVVVKANSRPLADLLALKARQQIRMTRDRLNWKTDELNRVRSVYDGMSREQFKVANAPQVWVEERQIPRTLSGRVPSRGAVVLDLGCGPGTSTATICTYAHPSWTIIGVDLSENLVRWAQERAGAGEFVSTFWGRNQTIVPRFVAQSITEPWLTGGRLAEASVDLVNSSGVVGHHLTETDVRRVIGEARRVLKPGAYLALDTGPRTRHGRMAELMAEQGFTDPSFIKGTALDPRPKVVMRKR
jgi:SAM-dependent methyltransferase